MPVLWLAVLFSDGKKREVAPRHFPCSAYLLVVKAVPKVRSLFVGDYGAGHLHFCANILPPSKKNRIFISQATTENSQKLAKTRKRKLACSVGGGARERQWRPMHPVIEKRIHPASSCLRAWVSSRRGCGWWHIVYILGPKQRLGYVSFGPPLCACSPSPSSCPVLSCTLRWWGPPRLRVLLRRPAVVAAAFHESMANLQPRGLLFTVDGAVLAAVDGGGWLVGRKGGGGGGGG